MRLCVILAVIFSARVVCAQPSPSRSLNAGPEPADAVDDAILRRTLYGSVPATELTAQQAQEMVDAAARMFDRRQAKVDRAKHLIEEGVMPRLALTPFLEELDRSRRTLDMARGRADLFNEIVAMARVESTAFESQAPSPSVVEKYRGSHPLRTADLTSIERAFHQQFGRNLPVSALGATAFHRSLGWDHRGRADVAVNPDQTEGLWLRAYLQALQIPYLAFRSALPGRASGAHVHIGPPSERLRHGS